MKGKDVSTLKEREGFLSRLKIDKVCYLGVK